MKKMGIAIFPWINKICLFDLQKDNKQQLECKTNGWGWYLSKQTDL